MEGWVHDNSVVLVKNENYWDAENVTLERIEFTITTDTNSLIGMYQTGDLDILKVDNSQVDTYKSERGFTQRPRLKVTFIEFNPRNEFLSNIKIREALSIAFDRQAYATNIVKNPELAAYGLVPFGVKGLDGGDFREQQGNLVVDSATDPDAIARAQTLLQEGLDELGKTVEDLQDGFVVQCLTSDSAKLQAQTIQAMWKENLGIDMTVQPLEIGVLLPMLIGGTFDCVIGGGQDSDYADPAGFMNFIYEEGKWDDPEFLALMEEVHTQTGDERIATWMEIEALVLNNFIYIPQVYAINNWAIAENVKGLSIWSFGYEFDYKYVCIAK
jgi:oligopeptide transport system substrate-binding protein